MQCEKALRRTEQRSVVLQLERLMTYPMVRERVEKGDLFLHGWYYMIEEGEVSILDVQSGKFVPASVTDVTDTSSINAKTNIAVI